jgi:hypothetical protein
VAELYFPEVESRVKAEFLAPNGRQPCAGEGGPMSATTALGSGGGRLGHGASRKGGPGVVGGHLVGSDDETVAKYVPRSCSSVNLVSMSSNLGSVRVNLVFIRVYECLSMFNRVYECSDRCLIPCDGCTKCSIDV